MTHAFFEGFSPIKYEGSNSTNPMAFRHYNPDEVVLGKRLEDHLRFAVAYWHSFDWEGGDPFGGPTFERPWHPQNSMKNARLKADIAFDMFALLGQPYFCFHDADIRPDQGNFADNLASLNEITDYIGAKMQAGGTKLL